MNQDTFTRRQVERSFRKFKDIVDDLLSAKFQTWDDTFSHLIVHCETDPVMRVVTDPLRANKRVSADKWFQDCMVSVRGMVGSARYQLPHDDEDQTALLYQFFLQITKSTIDVSQFCMAAYGTTNYQEMVQVFNRELVLKFAREVSYRLDEIIQDIGDKQEVSREAMAVFHYHDYSVNIQGGVQGSNIAGGQSSITNPTATYYDDKAALSLALKAIRPLVRDLAEAQQNAVECAIDLLVRGAEDSTVSAEEVVQATSLIAGSSPTLRQRLSDIAGRLGVSLAGSAIFQGIKAAFGIH